MTRILTAIDDEKILKKITKNKITNNKNIFYKEAILDTLKKNKNINILIISEKISGDIDLILLIKKIKKINKKIKIIIILSNKKIEKELIKIDIKDIYYDNFFSINKLLKTLNQKKDSNFFYNIKNRLNNEIIKIINNKKQKTKRNKKNVICILGENKIDKKIIELIILKKLINKNKKIIIINLKINKKGQKTKNRKIIKLKKIKNKYNLKLKIKVQLLEKKINKNIKEITNINKITKNKNYFIVLNILKKLIKKYSKQKYYILLNIIDFKLNIIQNTIIKKYINILIFQNNKNNLLRLNKYKNKNLYLVINNYNRNNLSKYFYKIILRNKFKKIKTINLN